MRNLTIPVILTVYKKPDFLEKQLQSFCEQSCVDNIDLHIISNNPNFDYKTISDKFANNIKITFVQKNNDYGCFERHLYAYEKKFEYVIMIDDDVNLNKNDIENIFNCREKNSVKSAWMRIFGDMKSKDPYDGEIHHPGLADFNYSYFGVGFSIIDCSIYNFAIDLFFKINETLLNKHQLNLGDYDDIFISWIAHQYDYKIMSHGTSFKMNDGPNALWRKIVFNKAMILKFLDNIHPWKPISKIEHRKKQIILLYKELFERSPDRSGLENYLNSTLTIPEIRNIFCISDEYRLLKKSKKTNLL